MRRMLGVFSLVVVLLTAAACQPGARGGPGGAQAENLRLINDTRGQRGLPPLQWTANTSAQAWADHLAATGTFGDDPGFSNGPGCAWAGNFAAASSVAEAHNLLVQSPPHYRNMTGNYSAVGIGVARNANFTYVVEDYILYC